MSWIATGVGVGGGALVGSYGHDNWGWSKDAIWQGAAVGGVGGYAVGAGAAGAGAGAASGGTSAGTASGGAFSAAGAIPGGAAAGGGGGMSMGTTLMLGQAGMGLASAFSSSGQRPTKRVKLSAQGKELESTLRTAVKGQYDKAIGGDARDKAFGAISAQRTQEGTRQRASMGTLQKAQAAMYNTRPNDRGGAAMGGAMLKGQLADTGTRMEGLFAETSILNSYTKEGLMNSVSQIQNWQNRENVVAQFTSQSNLADWNAANVSSAQRGAAIGGAAMAIGSTQLNQQYMNQYKNAMA